MQKVNAGIQNAQAMQKRRNMNVWLDRIFAPIDFEN
jgi:hypothetical protein